VSKSEEIEGTEEWTFLQKDSIENLRYRQRNYFSSEMTRRLFKLVRRKGLPDNFVSKRCLNCCYNVRIKDLYNEKIVTCFIVLCPYLGKGYIYRKRKPSLWRR